MHIHISKGELRVQQLLIFMIKVILPTTKSTYDSSSYFIARSFNLFKYIEGIKSWGRVNFIFTLHMHNIAFT